MVKVATWNVNSLRVRLAQVVDWITKNQPTFFMLQETKIQDHDFPNVVFQELGYQMVFTGQKAYNGVAILSREPINQELKYLPFLEEQQKRFLAVTIHYKHTILRIINLYVPNGASVGSEKFLYKLQWLEALETFLKQEIRQYENIIVLGDFNIAPEAVDVYDPIKWEGRVLFSEPERKHFKNLLSIGFHDAFRLKAQASNVFSWWDYRTFGFRRNEGLRIDHILITEPLVKYLENCYIDTHLRSLEQPSDHAIVIADFSFN